MMMELRKVEEALELAKVAMQTELGSSRDKLVSVIYCQILGMRSKERKDNGTF